MPGRAPSLWWGAALLVLFALGPAGCGRGEPSGLPRGKGTARGAAGSSGSSCRPRPALWTPIPRRTRSPSCWRQISSTVWWRSTWTRSSSDLAESWEIGDAGRAYTFRLGDGIRWHDGEPFTAEDVRWTLESLAGRRSLAAEAVRRIAAIETPDARTVVIRLTEPWAPFLTTLASNGAFILPRHLADADPSSPAWKPVGTGPFRLGERVRGRSLTLEANRAYFKPGPALDRLTYLFEPDSDRGLALLTSGAADYLVVRPALDRLPGLARDPQLRVLTYPSEGRSYLAFNLRRPPFADRRVREAINRALDRPALVELQVMGYASPELDAALAEGARTPDLTRRALAYGRAQEILARDLPIAPLAENVHVTVCRKEVTGLPHVGSTRADPRLRFQPGAGRRPAGRSPLMQAGRRGWLHWSDWPWAAKLALLLGTLAVVPLSVVTLPPTRARRTASAPWKPASRCTWPSPSSPGSWRRPWPRWRGGRCTGGDPWYLVPGRMG